MKPVKNTIQLRGRYHFKKRVPAEIRHLYAGRDIHQEKLETSDPTIAERKVRAIVAIMDAQLEQVRAEAGWKALAKHLPADQRKMLEEAGGLSGLLTQFQDAKRAVAFASVGEPQPDDYGPEMIGSVDYDAAARYQIEYAAHRATVEAMRSQANAKGKALRQLGKDVDLDGDVFSLRDVIEKWAPTVDAQSADSARYYVRRFTELNGEIAVTDLTKAQLRDYAEAIKGLPVVTSAKLPDGRFVRDLTFTEAVAWAKKNGKETLSDKTRDKYVSMMKRLLSFAAEQDYREGNPWADYKLPRVKMKYSEKQKEDRRPFTPEEERRILDFISGSNQPQYGKTTIDYWAPWIAAHQGTRIQEVCQLRLCDFEDRDGHWSMQITDEGDDMRAKSGATVRWVPVHPKLLKNGLRDHIEARRKAMPADALAFNQWHRYAKQLVEQQPDNRGRVSGPYGKRFATLRKKLEITGEKVAFHSFRHRLQDAAEEAGIPRPHRRYLTGRANKDATEGGYGDGAAMKYLFKSLAEIDPTETGA